jgi:hypothetical protein
MAPRPSKRVVDVEDVAGGGEDISLDQERLNFSGLEILHH